jgi:hypothetical protein
MSTDKIKSLNQVVEEFYKAGEAEIPNFSSASPAKVLLHPFIIADESNSKRYNKGIRIESLRFVVR